MNPALRFISANHWAIVPSVFDALLRIVEQHDTGLRATPEQIRQAQGTRAGMFDDMNGGAGSEPLMQVRGDTAVVPIRGVLARYSDQINGACQDQGRSAESIQADLAAAVSNPNVARIILRLDSPGGSVAGTAETGAAIRAASAAGKRVVAYVDGLAASAAYWLASQADEIVASSDGTLVGSIGVIMATVDATKAQEKQGYKVNVHRSVDLKAPGTANESLTPAQAASIGKVLAGMHALFADAVSTGRGLTQAQVDLAATGEVFTASDAIGMGLVDRVGSWSSVMADPSRGIRATQKADNTTARAITASALPKELPMSKSLEQAAALAEKHPAHAGMILSLAAKDNTEEQIVAAIAAKDAEAKDAAAKAEHEALKASVVDLTAKVAAAEAKAAADAAVIADLTAKVAAFDAHQKGSDAGNKIKGDGEDAKSEKVTQAVYDAMSPIDRSKFHGRGGTVA